MIGTWIDEGLEYFDVARGIKPDSKFFWQVRFGRITWVNYDPPLRDHLAYHHRCSVVNRAGYNSRCAISPLNKERKRLAAQQSILLFQRGFRIHKW